MKKISCIYGILNLVNEKIYVGSTNNWERRKKTHHSFLNHKKHANAHLQAAFNKYGSDNFAFFILEYAENADLDRLETLWIYNLKSNNPEYGYNIRMTPTSNRGIKYSEEVKRKLSELRKGKRPSEETLKKAIEANTGLKRSIETRKKMSDAKKGIHFSEEHRLKISKMNKGLKRSKETCLRISLINKGRKHSEEFCKKLSERMKGKKPSEETRQKMSRANKGLRRSAETCRKLAEAHRGVHPSEETRKKQRESRLRYYERVKKELGFIPGTLRSKNAGKNQSIRFDTGTCSNHQ